MLTILQMRTLSGEVICSRSQSHQVVRVGFKKDTILEPSHQVDITGIHVWQLAGATDSHLVKEKDSCSTTKYLRDSPLSMLVVVFFVSIN